MRFCGRGLLTVIRRYHNEKHNNKEGKQIKYSLKLLTTEVQNDLYVSVIWMLLCQGNVGSGGTLGTGVCICPQSVSGALQAYKSVKGKLKREK